MDTDPNTNEWRARSRRDAADAARVPPPSPVAAGDAWEHVFHATSAGRRRGNVQALASAGTSVLVFAVVLLVASSGHLDRVPLVFYGLMGVAVATQLWTAARRWSNESLSLSKDRVEYHCASYTIEARWSSVERVVSVGSRPTALALGLDRDSVTWEKRGRVRPWRRRPYRYARTIPIEPFIDDDPDSQVMAAIWAAAPRLLGAEPADVRPRGQAWGTRLLAFAIGVTPFAIVVGGLNGHQWSEPLTLAALPEMIVSMALIGALLVQDLWAWNGTTAERIVDWVGRVVTRPEANERRRDVIGAVAATWGRFAMFLLIGLMLAISSRPSDASLEAQYGPAHSCWMAGNTVVGCTLADGSSFGNQSGTAATCWFVEPATRSTRFHCRR
jgi:hypothetical protein